MRDRRYDEFLEICQNGIHRLAGFWSGGWQPVDEVDPAQLWRARIIADVSHVVGDPVDHLVAIAAKFLCRHFAVAVVRVGRGLSAVQHACVLQASLPFEPLQAGIEVFAHGLHVAGKSVQIILKRSDNSDRFLVRQPISSQ